MEALGYAADVKPLFRENDRRAMRSLIRLDDQAI